MTEDLSALAYAVRSRVVGKYLGQLLLTLAALTAVPLAASLAFGEYPASLRYALVVALLTAVATPLARLPSPTSVQTNEALAATALIFVVAPLCMVYPLAGHDLALVDALFEAVSGITTTGLSTVPDIARRSHTFLFTRSWMQWYGGLGVAALSTALLMRHEFGARKLAGASGEDDLISSTRTHGLRMLSAYSVLTALGVIVLVALGVAPLVALTHVFAAVSTGGFSSYRDSLAGMQGWAAPALILLMSFAGAVPLMLYYRTLRQDWRAPLQDPQVRALLVATAAAALGLAVALHSGSGLSWTASLEHALSLGVSAQTTTGFSTLPVGTLDNTAKLILILSMILGGCVGSTAGGVKMLRVLIVLQLIRLAVRRTSMTSHAVLVPRLDGRTLEDEELIRVLLLIALFAAVVAGSWLVFVGFGYPPLDALFEVVSATATVGLSTGVTGVGLPDALKLVLCMDMLLGRVEVFALLVLLYPGTWLGKRMANS